MPVDVYLDGIYSEIALKHAGFDGLFTEIEREGRE